LIGVLVGGQNVVVALCTTVVELAEGIGLPDGVVIGTTGLVMVQLLRCEHVMSRTEYLTYGQSVTVSVWLLVTV
jgi:hypothetical protein